MLLKRIFVAHFQCIDTLTVLLLLMKLLHVVKELHVLCPVSHLLYIRSSKPCHYVCLFFFFNKSKVTRNSKTLIAGEIVLK